MSPAGDIDAQRRPTMALEDDGGVLRFGNRRLSGQSAACAFVLLALFLVGPALWLRIQSPMLPQASDVAEREYIAPELSTELPPPRQKASRKSSLSLRRHMERLRGANLWELPVDGVIPPVIFDSYPADIRKLNDIAVKKRLFLHTLLPAALVALDEVRRERTRLGVILAGMERCGELDKGAEIDAAFPAFTSCLSKEQMSFINTLLRKYRCHTLDELRRRVDVLPVSLVLAQGALESSWGGSRFAQNGNNIFGVWTWDEEGMVPKRRDAGKFHKVRSYGTILDSVRHYLLTINRHEAYTYLRTIRQQTFDPLALTEGLTLYSERGRVYVEEVKEMIRYNDLQRYDRCKLARIQTTASG